MEHAPIERTPYGLAGLASAASTEALRVLAVDDDPTVLALLEQALACPQAAGEPEAPAARFTPFCCASGEEAVEAVRNAVSEGRPFAVAFVDVRLGGAMDGMEVAAAIRGLDPDVSIVVITAYDTPTREELTRRAPPRDKLLYLQKPFHPLEVENLAAALGARWRLERQLWAANAHLEQQVQDRVEELTQVNERLKLDILERSQVEQELRESEQRLAAVFQGIDDTLLVCGRSGQVLDCNETACRRLGYGRDALLGLALADLCPPDEAPAWEAGRRGALSQGRCQWESAQRTKDGQVMPVEAVLTTIHVRGQKALLLVARDLTARKAAEAAHARLEAELRRTQKMDAVGTLAGGIAHDFNNILSAIVGYVDIAMSDLDEYSPVLEPLEEAVKATHHARDLVKQILTFSRQSPHEMRPVNLRPVVEQGLKLLQASMPRGVRIAAHVASDCGVVKADPVQMQQTLINLGMNAHHATQDNGGAIEIRVEPCRVDAALAARCPELREGAYVRLSVKDAGCGMDAATMERIFEPFFTTKPVGQGTGLGLATVHGIVRSHGGAIRVESAPGEGALFEVYLPQLERTAPARTAAPAPQGHERLLVVDDEEVLVRIGEKMLTRLGYEVTTRTSSVEALEAFRAQPDRFDVIVTDHAMPNMTGMQLIEEIRRIRPDVAVLLCTGFSDGLSDEQVARLGIAEVLMKPLAPSDLAKTIRRVLHGETPPDAGA